MVSEGIKLSFVCFQFGSGNLRGRGKSFEGNPSVFPLKKK